ncbi:MAG: hypothetical protein JO129_00230 [Candidatus Dependentiae bacterium]|nr:hypothetical protein [Candidatus Dependentiae bacterium]
MKKVIALGLATVFSVSMHASSASNSFSNGGAGQQNWNVASTFLRFETPYQSASPERLALFNTEDIREKHRASHHGDVEFVVFGNQNTNQANAAAYYMPGGLETLQFNASINAAFSGTNTLETYWSGVQGGTATYATLGTTGRGNTPANHAIGYISSFTSPTVYTGTPLTMNGATNDTYNSLTGLAYDVSVGTNLINVPGNAGAPVAANDFVIGTGAAGVYQTYDIDNMRAILSDNGSDLATVGNFNIDANKNIGIMRPWNFGVGYAPNVQFGASIAESEFVSAISPELKRSFWAIGATWKQLLTDKDTGFFLELSTVLQGVTMNMELNEVVSVELNANPYGNPTASQVAWAASWGAGTDYDAGDVVAPINMTQAFAQSAWEYGRIDGAQSVTRLADIELKLGYQFICEENVMSNAYIGIVIPTGNKAQSLYLAEPIVGNGFHFGLMVGSTQEIQWNAGTDTRWSLRSDANWRYLFQNTQVRSFDTLSNGQWSRYMMVWTDYAAEQTNGEVGTPVTLRNYTPGINVFTQEVNVTPGAQARWNQALVVESGSFKGEFGWNMLVRQAEQVSLVNAWVNNSVAFVDASNNSTSLFNITRTIYNDSYQSTPVTNGGAGGTGIAGESLAQYNAASISASDLNLDSAASPAIFTNTPYLALGYAFNEEKSSVFSIGISYEIAATNGYINDWTLWGKFGFSF